MYQENDQVGWTDAQWNRVRQTVSEEAARARVAASFLPIYGPLPRSTQVVPSERFDETNLAVDDAAVAPIVELQSTVTMSQAQVQEADMSTAVQLFRRATNILTRLEDWTIFNGKPLLYGNTNRKPVVIPQPFSAVGGEDPDWSESFVGRIEGFARDDTQDLVRVRIKGFTPSANGLDPELIVPPSPAAGSGYNLYQDREDRMYNRLLEKNPGALGLFDSAYATLDYNFTPYGLVEGVVAAISVLEAQGHVGPFACVLGTRAYQVAHQPFTGETVFARDRIEPLIGRELLRSSTVDDRQFDAQTQDGRGVVISLGGDAVDLAVAIDAEPEFLFISPEVRYTFRVYERFALRVKQPSAVVGLTAKEDPGALSITGKVMWSHLQPLVSPR
jgi:uncharacterized linocin/CFP29 family protein